MDLEEVRLNLIEKLKSHYGNSAGHIEAFFSRVQVQAAFGGFAILTTGSSFIKDWIETHYLSDMTQALSELYGGEWTVQIEVDTTQAPTEPERREPTPKPEPQQEATAATQKPAPKQESEAAQTDPEPSRGEGPRPEEGTPSLTFENFVTGGSNRMAYSMAVEVADKPGKSSLNPLFIYGRSGVGKTHLLCAIKNYIARNYPNLKVRYIDSMEMVNEYSSAAINKSFKSFEDSFKDLDVLLIDDIQGLQGKQQTLDTLFRIFNELIPKGKQFVFSADRAPKNIDLDERYVSRFNSGATIDVHPPDAETKRNIAKSFLAECQREESFEIAVPDDALDYIAENSSSNVRELKSAITNVVFAMKVDPEHSITKQQVESLLSNHFASEASTRITMDTVKEAVCSFYGVTKKDMEGPGRGKAIKNPRNVAIYLCREVIGLTFAAIGDGFNRSHNTIMHSYDVVAGQVSEDYAMREEIEAIREKIRTQQF